MRSVTQPPYVTLDTAMARISSHNLPKPMVLADVSDNAGGGAASGFDLHPAGAARKEGQGRGHRHVLGSGGGEARCRSR